MVAFDVAIIDMIYNHTFLADFNSKKHARHRLFNKVYKYERKMYIDQEFPDEIAKTNASDMARRACLEWEKNVAQGMGRKVWIGGNSKRKGNRKQLFGL